MTTAIGRTRRSSEHVWIGPGGVSQHGGDLPLYVCNQCGADVVWVESRKIGRKYLANVSHAYSGARFYIGANVHRCAPGWTNPMNLNPYFADLVFDAEDTSGWAR